MYTLVFCEPKLLEIPVRHILIFLAVFLLSSPLFGQSEESIQFETFFEEAETSNSVQEDFQEPVLFPDKQLEPFQDEDADGVADTVPHSETEAKLEQELLTETEGETGVKTDREIDSRNPETLQQKSRNQAVGAVKKRHGVLSYRKENGAWGWYDYGDEGNDGKYVGDIVNMKPNGSGIFVYGKGKWEDDKYEGQWKDGEFHGNGTFTRTNGQRFFGEWKNSILWNITGYDKFGKIIKKYRRGVQLIIRKKDEEEKKTAVNKRKRGILYREVPRSKWDRSSKKWMTEGDRKIHGIYEGEILDGVPDGEGTYTWYNVEKYVGEFRKGFFHGHGTFTYLSGITADGVFRKDKEWDTLRTEENGEVTGKFVKGRYYPLKP